MNDLIKSLQTMRDMVASRIQMLQEGTTFYTEEKKAYYLREYASRLRDLDQQILSLSLALVNPTDDLDDPPKL